MKTELTIQEVAQRTGLSVDTLRYYERIGLIEPVGRSQNGHRRYTEHDLAWIDLLLRLRNTGMPLAQMVRFAQLRRQGAATATERRMILEAHQHSLQERMRDLEQHMSALQQKIVRIKEVEAQYNTAPHPASIFGQDEVSVNADGLETTNNEKRKSNGS